MSDDFVSVIVPMRNAEPFVLSQIGALAAQSINASEYEVIWVDNGSTTRTWDVVEAAIVDHPNMRLISARRLRSSYFARNEGARAARGALLLFCDADDVVDRSWIASMRSALASHDVVGGAMDFVSLDPRRSSSAPSSPVVDRAPQHGFLPTTPTANLGVRRSVFEALGGFRSDRASCEDQAFCWRAQVAGFSFNFDPDAIVHYRQRGSEWERFRRIWRSGRWYPVCAGEFVSLGADSPALSPTLRRIWADAFAPALRGPRRRHARVAVWNLAVISAHIARPHVRTQRA